MSPIIGYASELKSHPALPNIFRYAWLEGNMEATLAFIADEPDWHRIEQWPSGRLFGDVGEYRWQAVSTNGLKAVLILDEGVLPEGFSGIETIEKYDDSSFILWGEWIDPEKDLESNPGGGPVFYAREIPGILKYPVPSEQDMEHGKSPSLVVRRYRHETKGEFVRCVGLTMKSEDVQEDANDTN